MDPYLQPPPPPAPIGTRYSGWDIAIMVIGTIAAIILAAFALGTIALLILFSHGNFHI